MSILDDAIREHLELKRAHGADDAELKRLEDEAFGPPQRPDEPDPFAEAPTEFLTTPESGAGEMAPDGGGRREPNITDLQEAPPRAEAEPASELEAATPDESPAEEEHPAGEHETIAEPGPTTEERHAIASQPTEIFDVEGQFEQAPPEADAPSDEQLAEAEQEEPRLAPAAADDEPADEFDEFFSEQRLSDELNAALEAPLPDEPGGPATEEAAVYVDTDADEPEAGAQGELQEEEVPAAEEDSREFELVEEPEEEEPREPAPPAADSSHHDALEQTPEFLEESPEDDDLWFEQKPPKDIDFGD
jgi:hypothetical protein